MDVTCYGWVRVILKGLAIRLGSPEDALRSEAPKRGKKILRLSQEINGSNARLFVLCG